jgi:hypothetical protein
MCKTALKYKILRVRCKISYEAFIRKMTITEFITTQILRTYETLTENGILEDFVPSEST